MTGPRTRDDVDRRVEAVRERLRQRRAAVEPDPRFVDRIIARLPRNETWPFDWAVRRVLPVSLALAMALTIAVVATHGSASRSAASAALSTSSHTGIDPLDWLLESRQELR